MFYFCHAEPMQYVRKLRYERKHALSHMAPFCKISSKSVYPFGSLVRVGSHQRPYKRSTCGCNLVPVSTALTSVKYARPFTAKQICSPSQSRQSSYC